MFNNSLMWLLLAFCFLLFEMGHPGLLFFLSFACGSLITSVFSCLVNDTGAQLIAFIASSIIAMSILKRYLPVMNRSILTNGDALKGRHVVVAILVKPDQPGAVKIDGTLWTAYSGDAARYAPGTVVSVHAVRGAHVIVKSIHTNFLA
jgi:membrane protein implicated in regulation of membrane protease activity